MLPHPRAPSPPLRSPRLPPPRPAHRESLELTATHKLASALIRMASTQVKKGQKVGPPGAIGSAKKRKNSTFDKYNRANK